MHRRLTCIVSFSAAAILIAANLLTARTIELNNLVFLPPAAPVNEIELTLATDVLGDDSDITQFSGFSMAALEFQVVGTDVVPTGIAFTGGQVALSDLAFSYFFNTIEVTTMGLVGTPNTPLPPGTVINNQFDATEHEIVFDQGVVSGAGMTIDLSAIPLGAPGIGTGQVSVVPVGTPVGNQYTFAATISLPIDINQSFEIPDVPVFGTVNATLSGAGSAVSREQFTITIIPGDFNGDQLLDCDDLTALENELGGSNLAFDTDMDGAVTSADVTFWLNDLRMALDGDANLDDFVDGTDFIVWNASKFTATDHWCAGDFNADGFVDGSDFIVWNDNKFTSADAVAVPEPYSLSLLLVGLLLMRRLN